jgi:DNA mismatch endonuclease (patch repair protein)
MIARSITARLGYPVATDDGVSIRMRGNRRRDTGPEVAVRSCLHRRGLRYRVDHRIKLPGATPRPDIVFTKRKLAVFIDGCFWHCCPEHGTLPASNVDYWLPKLERNVMRDAANNDALRTAGWTVVRAWEHEPAAEIAERIALAFKSTQPNGSSGRDVEDEGLGVWDRVRDGQLHDRLPGRGA